MANQGIFALAEGATMEAFLKDKKVPGDTLLELVNNYCATYNVPPETRKLMHDIRQNRNAVAHGSDGELKKLDYVSQEMKQYQSFYFAARGKAGKTKAYNVDLAKGSAERVRKNPNKPKSDKPKPTQSANGSVQNRSREAQSTSSTQRASPSAPRNASSSSSTSPNIVKAPKKPNDSGQTSRPKQAGGPPKRQAPPPNSPKKSTSPKPQNAVKVSVVVHIEQPRRPAPSPKKTGTQKKGK
jgi:hypothetical protein